VVTSEQLQQLGIGAEWVDALNETFQRFNINDVNQQGAFIGQCSHESNHFKALQENLNYKAETLHKLWPNRFPTMEVAQQFAGQPQKIANKVYGSRMGNRDESSGDGFRFCGRGLVQITGHDAYWHCGQALGVDLVQHPELAATPKYAALSAGWFWNTHNCNALSDAQDWTGLTKKINGGTFGLNERVFLTQKAIKVLSGQG
jgi:putative chitinase